MPIDMQSAIVAELIQRLQSGAGFGGEVFEDSVMRVLDSADDSLPDDFIIIQPGQTEVAEQVGPGTVRERVTLNITAITKQRGFAPVLRGARLGIKVALAGTKGGLVTQGVTQVAFLPETPMPPGEGRRWAAQVMPIQVTYQQPLK